MYIHPYIVIFNTDGQSHGLSTRPDGPNTLFHQSAATNDAPRDLLYIPITWNPSRKRPDSTLLLHLWSWHFRHCNCCWEHHNCVKIELRDASFIQRKRLRWHRTFLWCSPPLFLIPLPVPDLFQKIWFNSDSQTQFDSDFLLQFNTSCTKIIFWFKSQFIHTPRSPT